MTTPPLDLPALRKTAEAATDGPWEAIAGSWGGEGYIDRDPSRNGEPEIAVCDHDPDREHIAAFDPPTVLQLLDRVEELDRQLDAADRQIEARSGETAAERIWKARAEAAEKQVAQALADLNATIADAEPSNYEEDNYDAGYVHGLIEARDILTVAALDTHTPETETTP